MTFKKFTFYLNLVVFIAMLAVGVRVCDAADNRSITLNVAVDQALNVDFKGDGQGYCATVSGDMITGYTLRIVRNGEDELLFPIRAGIGELMTVTERNDGKQDIAYVVNNGSGYFIQDFAIIGYDGNRITTLATIDALKAEGIRKGHLKQQKNGLYLSFIKAEQGYSGPASKLTFKQYVLPFTWDPETNRYTAGKVSEQYVSACGVEGAAEVDQAELLSFFPNTPGFTWWYEDHNGEVQCVTLTNFVRNAAKNETVFSLQSQTEVRNAVERLVFAFQYVVRDNMVLEEQPREPYYWTRVNPVVLFTYPLEPGRKQIYLCNSTRSMVATILSNKIDPEDNLQTLKVRYELMTRSLDHVFYTEERVYKQGLGMVHMERTNEESKVIASLKLIKTGLK